MENSPNFLQKIQGLLLSTGGVGIFGKYRTINSVLKTVPLFLNLFSNFVLEPASFFQDKLVLEVLSDKAENILVFFKLKLRTITRSISIICTIHGTVISIEHLALLSAVFSCFVG